MEGPGKSYNYTKYGTGVLELYKVIYKLSDSEQNATKLTNSLLRNGVSRVEQLLTADEDDILKFRGVGKEFIKVVGTIRKKCGVPSKYVE